MLADDRLELVGVKVFSPGKEGRDAGELAGVGPCGVLATRSTEDLLALDADVVLLTCAASAIVGGLDDDVIAMLLSGKNVIATVAYHNVARSNWASAHRPAPAKLQEAAVRGGASLFGAGVHPSYMTERVAMTLAAGLGTVDHVRVVEALDFSAAPADMWGGLEAIGFGGAPESLGDDNMLARFGDMYYADLVANLAFGIRGAGNDDIRTETRLVGRPVAERLQLPQITVEPGCVGALHLTTDAFVGGDLVATNEEVWFLGAPNAFRGEDLPFEGWKQGLIGYTIEVRNSSTRLRSQIEYEILSPVNPVTQMSVRSLIDAIGPVCQAQPGVLIDDVSHQVRLDPRLGAV
ncbi:hypothetical protein C1S81_11905 [Mycolicibacterium neoaurum]|nr:hypothetical protein C1S81_11905 [Mycolicibacterium neoaurum]